MGEKKKAYIVTELQQAIFQFSSDSWSLTYLLAYINFGFVGRGKIVTWESLAEVVLAMIGSLNIDP